MGYWQNLKLLMDRLEADMHKNKADYEELNAQLVARFLQARRMGQRIYFAGNGGSAGIAVHMNSDFLKNGRVRTGDLFGAAAMTCLANDIGYENVFAEQIAIQADKGDILVAISSSGCSPNILAAVKAARQVGCEVLTLSGFAADNPLRKQGDWNIYVPSSAYGIVESIHHAVLQRLVDEMMEEQG